MLHLPAGTHHVKFLVNDDMVCSTHLPTTVDFTNILVNYIEVAAESVQTPAKSTTPVATPAPAPVPSRPLDIRTKPSGAAGSNQVPPSNPPVSPAPQVASQVATPTAQTSQSRPPRSPRAACG